MKRKIVIVYTIALMLILLGIGIWLISAGHVETAIQALQRWGEDGTMDCIENWIIEVLIPMLGLIAAGAGATLAMLLPLLKKLKDAKKKLDEGTAEAVATYGERNEMMENMRSFMDEQRVSLESLRAEQRAIQEEHRAALAVMMEEQRASLTFDRIAIKRIEGKVDGLRRMEVAAAGATSELVKKGTVLQIAAICKETEGGSEEEGGDARETVGDDNKAADDPETH